MSTLEEFLTQAQEMLVKEVREKYTPAVADHWQHPRNPHVMRDPDGHAHGLGVCGDDMDIYLRVRGGRVVEASFTTDGCITSIVSGSMAVQLATGRTLAELRSVSARDVLEGLGGLPEESEHCAELAASTLREAAVDCLLNATEPWKKLYRK